MRALLVLLALLLALPAAAQSADDLLAQGRAAYDAGDYAESGRLYAAGIEAGSREGGAAYNAACAFALSGDPEAAFHFLRVAADFGFSDADLLTRDTDLESLRDDDRWPTVVADYERRAARAERFWNSPAMRTPFQENLSEDEKLAGLARLWSEAKFNFANFDLVPDLDWDSLYVATIPEVRATASTLDYYRVLMAMVAQLQDGHSNVYAPEALYTKAYARPGLRTRLIDGRVVIVAVRDSALAARGVSVGQEVVGIDGMDVHDYAATHVRPYQSASTAQDLNVRTYEYALFAGDVEAEIGLDLRTADGSTWSLPVRRLTSAQVQALGPSRERFAWAMRPGNVAHVQLNSFGSPEAAEQFEAQFDAIVEADALVLDVRNNGGGSSGVGYRVLCALTDAASIQTSSWRTRLYRPAYRAWGRPEATEGDLAGSWSCGGSRHFDGPVAVLAGPRTFSAAEDFAVAFDLMDRGPIVGEPTGGSTGQPLFFRLPGGGSARVTSKRDAYPDGRDFVGTGVLPDVAAAAGIDDVRAGRDAVLEAALDALADG